LIYKKENEENTISVCSIFSYVLRHKCITRAEVEENLFIIRNSIIFNIFFKKKKFRLTNRIHCRSGQHPICSYNNGGNMSLFLLPLVFGLHFQLIRWLDGWCPCEKHHCMLLVPIIQNRPLPQTQKRYIIYIQIHPLLFNF